MEAIPAVTGSFARSCAEVGLRPNLLKTNYTPGRRVDLASLPNGVAGVKLETRAIVLRHGLPTPVPAMPASQAAADSMLAEGSPEVTKLISERSKLFLRIRQLRAAGLPTETTLPLLRTRMGSDYVFLARTCGIPEADGNIMDAAVASEVQHVVAQADLVGIPLNRVFLAGTLSGLGFECSVNQSRSLGGLWARVPSACAAPVKSSRHQCVDLGQPMGPAMPATGNAGSSSSVGR